MDVTAIHAEQGAPAADPPRTDPPRTPPPPTGPRTPPPPTGPKKNEAVAPSRVDEKIVAAVEAAPPLPDDVAARLVELIRTTSPARRPAPASYGTERTAAA